ncbi:MAG: leucine-rich repeat domain-containing protein [Clostridia bacterium]|nr:leucine-rich repeat domain-containing protein [Clostridia bacterium]
MKKKLLSILTVIFAVIISAFTLTACGGGGNGDGGNGGNGGQPVGPGSEGVGTHECVFAETVVPSTCSAEGYTLHSCECGESYKTNFTARNPHDINTSGVCTVCSAEASDIRIVKITGKNEYSVRGLGSFTGTDIIIPAEYKGAPVTEINASAFKDKTSITSIYIPSTVKTIGKQAFSGCSSLSSITFAPECDLESVGNNAFQDCSSLIRTIVDNGIYLGTPKIFFGVTDGAVDVSIIDGCSIILEKAFSLCSNVKSVSIPASVKMIGENAFYRCNGLQYVNYGGELSTWATFPFADIYANPLYYAGVLKIGGEIVTDLNITGDVISDYAFAGCTSLEKACLNVNSIGNQAFYNCTRILCLELGSSLTSIGDKAFESCRKLIEVKNDSQVVIEAGVESTLNGNVGVNVKNLYSSKSGSSKFSSDTDGNDFFIDGENVYLIGASTQDKTYVIPANVTHIANYAFYNDKNIETVVFGSTLKEIGDYSFYGSALKSVEIPANVKYIGNSAFQNSKNVETVTFASSNSKLKSFGNYAFAGLPLVTSIYLPDGLELMGDYSFADCTELIEFSMPGTLHRLAYRIINGCMKITVAEFRGTGFMELTMQPVEGHPNELYFFFWYYLSGLEWCETYGGSWQVEPHGR